MIIRKISEQLSPYFFNSFFLVASPTITRSSRNPSLICELNTLSSFVRLYSVSLIIIMFISSVLFSKMLNISSSLGTDTSLGCKLFAYQNPGLSGVYEVITLL